MLSTAPYVLVQALPSPSGEGLGVRSFTWAGGGVILDEALPSPSERVGDEVTLIIRSIYFDYTPHLLSIYFDYTQHLLSIYAPYTPIILASVNVLKIMMIRQIVDMCKNIYPSYCCREMQPDSIL